MPEPEELLANAVPLPVERFERLVELVKPFVRIVGEVGGGHGAEEDQAVEREQGPRHRPLVGRRGGSLGERGRDVNVPQQADCVQGAAHHDRSQGPHQDVARQAWKRVPQMDTDEHADERDHDREGGRHDVRQVLGLTEQAKHDRIEGELPDAEEEDDPPVQRCREGHHHVPPQLLDPGLVTVGDRLDPVVEVLQAPHERLEHRLELGDPERG